MRLNAKILNLLLEFICLLYILLFVYAAISKFLDFENFQVQLGQSPLLSAYTGFVSYSVILIEIIISVLLSIPRVRLIGLFSSFCLMILFTAYIIIITNYSSYVPCSCGGILENMDWNEHLIFNICFVVLAVIAILSIINIKNENGSSKNKIKSKYSLDTKSGTILLGVMTFICSTFIAGLYISSDNRMHNENPFIRRFIQGSATKTAGTSLTSNSQYFAGTNGTIIYLGDNQAPLHITAYDSTLKVKYHYKIQLEREDFPFRTVQIRVAPPYFYLMDGTVPVIYKGNISDWKAKLLMHDNNYYFSKAEIIAANKIVFRAQESKSLNNILGTFTFSDSLEVQYAPKLLQKQIDGFFDTDGMMHYDEQLQKFIYVYYYRNQFIIADKNLNLIYRGTTIDTTTHANLKIAFIKNTKQRKIASPPSTVNQLTAVSDTLLFVNSKLIGRYEPKEMWKEASIVDVYNIEKNTYLSSIYIYNVNEEKVQSMLILGNNLYTIIGHNLHRYHLDKHFVTVPKTKNYRPVAGLRLKTCKKE
jgi:uncharacterized membrane protein YphA (DoxX/SURF4 family)